MPSAAASSRLALSESCSSGSGPIMAQISWSLVMPSALRMTTTGTSSPMVLCCSCRRPVRSTMTVRDLRSCVDDVTLALTEPLESSSRMMRFLLSCSWIRHTFSTPLTTK
jgi:hypothetical protein